MGLGYTDHQGNNIITKPTEQGGIVAIYYLGTSIGTLLGGALSDHVGRIRTVLLGCFFAIFGAALQVRAILHQLVTEGTLLLTRKLLGRG